MAKNNKLLKYYFTLSLVYRLNLLKKYAIISIAFFSKKESKEFQAQENNIGNQFLEFLPVATALSPTDILHS